MKLGVVVVTALCLLGTVPHAAWSAGAAAPQPVLVELFTSEGCSSCPPADQLLMHLNQRHMVSGAPVIVLEEHVDYWDNSAWTDPFSKHLFTVRQSQYAMREGIPNVYTPQMVVDGVYGFNGSDSRQALATIKHRAKSPHSIVKLHVARSEQSAHVTVAIAGRTNGNVVAAIAEDGLSSDVRGGENAGQHLAHIGITRELLYAGQTHKGVFAGDIVVPIDPAWHSDRLKVVVFVQNPSTGEIYGAGESRVPPE